jgi:membrane associated rhomboid family serine protease
MLRGTWFGPRARVALVAFLLIVAGLAYRASTPDGRAEALRRVIDAIRRVIATLARNRRDCAPFIDDLRTIMPRVFIAPAIIALNVLVFAWMIVGRGAFADPETLLGWGANFGPRTTNGEWWRLLTSAFVHTGLLALVINILGFAQLAFVLERLVGRATFALVYVSSTIFAGLVSVIVHPVTVSAGASGGVFGLHGLVLACAILDVWRPTERPVPLSAAKHLAPAAAIFMLYNLFESSVCVSAELAGGLIGLASGLVLANGDGERRPSQRLLRIAAASATVVAIVTAFSLRGIADVRPEITNVLAIEDRTAPVYRTASDRLSKGQISTNMAADLIELKILPELRTAEERLRALHGVPSEQRQWVADAEEYVRLRYESWRLRAEWLHASATPPPRERASVGVVADATWRERAARQHRSTQMLSGRAEAAERTALEARLRIKPAV